MKKLVMLMVVCCFILTGCGSSGSKGKSDLSTLSKNTELTSQLSKKKDTPEFILMGTHFELPCKLQDFYDQGWELIDQIDDNPFVKDTFMIEPESSTDIMLVKDYKKLYIEVGNKSKEATLLNAEAIVSKVSFYNYNNITADDFVFAGKGTIKSSIEDLTALYADYEMFSDEESYIAYTANNGCAVFIEKGTDKSTVKRVSIEMRDEITSMLKGMNLFENEVIDSAKNNSFKFKFNCETSVKYTPKKYKKLLEDIETEDGVPQIIVNGKVVEKAVAKSSELLTMLDDGEEIYIIEDELGNEYAFYSKVGDNFVISNLNVGDTVKLYCGRVELINVNEEVKCPLLKAYIVYVNDTLLVDTSLE